ncbi:ABC transporter permease [Candidatus Nitrotoga sp. M5]|uniref:ABC transporter permease n=1 Tax=Candidatus Nitrotoga sp. M5 TaxID=2890409 RepID=UPI001EF19A5F|nr:ABC transporter permease [Candidatus Nitrotoga sp. M5]CAH1386499.1 Transport permease protein [Candidatus Nitrotoga sp. M5]
MPIRNLWPYRWLLLNFLSREIKSRYIGSVSGIFWALLHPLALLAVYAVVFTAIFKVKFPELEGHSFILFVAVALWPWLCFQEGAQRGALSVQNGGGLIKKVAFPHELLVYGAVLSTYAVHVSGFLLVLVVLALTGSDLHFSSLPLVLLLFSMQLLFTSGLALILAALQVLLKDVEHFLTPLFMVWFYATPILYPASLVPQQIQQIIALNPLSYFITRVRELLMTGNSQIGWQDLVMLLSCMLFFLIGRWFFNRLSPYFEDFI